MSLSGIRQFLITLEHLNKAKPLFPGTREGTVLLKLQGSGPLLCSRSEDPVLIEKAPALWWAWISEPHTPRHKQHLNDTSDKATASLVASCLTAANFLPYRSKDPEKVRERTKCQGLQRMAQGEVRPARKDMHTNWHTLKEKKETLQSSNSVKSELKLMVNKTDLR